MPEDLWGPIAPDEWRTTPCLSGRVANEDDVSRGLAVFVIGSHKAAEPVQLSLPACGFQRLENGTTRAIVIVQAERFDGQVFLGVRYLSGGNGVCTMHEVELIEKPNASFHAVGA
jgi:hypothetical protein